MAAAVAAELGADAGQREPGVEGATLITRILISQLNSSHLIGHSLAREWQEGMRGASDVLLPARACGAFLGYRGWRQPSSLEPLADQLF